jgi:hypothetical protein
VCQALIFRCAAVLPLAVATSFEQLSKISVERVEDSERAPVRQGIGRSAGRQLPRTAGACGTTPPPDCRSLDLTRPRQAAILPTR